MLEQSNTLQQVILPRHVEPPRAEAVIALEAECQRNPGNAEAWRLLGTVQAENDDDQQAIAAMNRWVGQEGRQISFQKENKDAVQHEPARGRGDANRGVGGDKAVKHDKAVLWDEIACMRATPASRRLPPPPACPCAPIPPSPAPPSATTWTSSPSVSPTPPSFPCCLTTPCRPPPFLPPSCSALGADPSDLDVLLSLGVSHTNELEQGEALSHLRQWVVRHPRHAPASQAVPDPGDPSQTAAYVVRAVAAEEWSEAGWVVIWGWAAGVLSPPPAPHATPSSWPAKQPHDPLHPRTLRLQAALFEAAARARPEDAELHSALGVVYNLARRYDDAVVAFQ